MLRHIRLRFACLALALLFPATAGLAQSTNEPASPLSAETSAALSILIATQTGVPVSTTHAITGAIVGVGATRRLSAVRWGVAGRIVWAWVLTIPSAAAVAALTWVVLHRLVGA